tara:strand:- start:310 stop:1086 length:777 start_codon:yes stop_codon:yes gene_type:complete
MKVVILAGGLGTRLSEETTLKPKPMVEIGNYPIIVHIMKYYSLFGFNEFIICCGYKGYVIKEYFANYNLHRSDITIDLDKGSTEVHRRSDDNWKITLIDTGDESLTGGRLRRVKDYINDDEMFHFTYGDGLSNVDLNELVSFHKKHGKKATVTAVYPPGRFGTLKINDNQVTAFEEKPVGDGSGRINGGYFVLHPSVIDLIDNDQTVWEKEPMKRLTSSGELMAFNHDGFWHPMDTLRDKHHLEKILEMSPAPWQKKG